VASPGGCKRLADHIEGFNSHHSRTVISRLVAHSSRRNSEPIKRTSQRSRWTLAPDNLQSIFRPDGVMESVGSSLSKFNRGGAAPRAQDES